MSSTPASLPVRTPRTAGALRVPNNVRANHNERPAALPVRIPRTAGGIFLNHNERPASL